jgi:hypothetical protein
MVSYAYPVTLPRASVTEQIAVGVVAEPGQPVEGIGDRLLLETSDTLDKIAARLGFADASNFSRTFKGINGRAPGEFRRNKQRY